MELLKPKSSLIPVIDTLFARIGDHEKSQSLAGDGNAAFVVALLTRQAIQPEPIVERFFRKWAHKLRPVLQGNANGRAVFLRRCDKVLETKEGIVL